MDNLTEKEIVAELRKAATAIYIAVEQPVAIELSRLFTQAAEHLDFNIRLVEALRARLKENTQ